MVTNSHRIDLRSDTVTMPSHAMRQAMAEAPVGDDVYGEDPTVNRLESVVAEMAGLECGLFLPTGTQSNLVALLTHCGRGDEYIVGQQAHTYKYEGGGAAALGGIQPQPLDFLANGTLDLDAVRAVVKPHDDHFARSRLLCLENTMQGRVLPLQYLQKLGPFARTAGLALHLDGARLCNAAVALKVGLPELTSAFDSVSICLSKGLGAPVGSVLLGTRDFIRDARRWRKMTGGGMRQAGIVAAAGLFALQHNFERLADDHHRANQIAEGLKDVGYEVEATQTNMVYVNCGNIDFRALAEQLRSRNIWVNASSRLRLVTHMDIEDADVPLIIAAFRDCRGAV